MDFEGTLDDLEDIQAEAVSKMAMEAYFKNREKEKSEHKVINSEKMNYFMMSALLLNKVSKRIGGRVKIIDDRPVSNIIAELDSFEIDSTELDVLRYLLSVGASINFEPLTNGRICVSIAVPGTYE